MAEEERQIHVEIVTPEKAVFEGKADEVVLPASEGEVGILPGHLPLLTSLGIGGMVVKKDGKERQFFVDGGYAEVLPDRVSVLTEDCEGVADIDAVAARKALKEAERELEEMERASAETVEEEAMKRHQDALKRARMRLVFAEEEEEK